MSGFALPHSLLMLIAKQLQAAEFADLDGHGTLGVVEVTSTQTLRIRVTDAHNNRQRYFTLRLTEPR